MQQINLYLDEFRAPRDPLPPLLMAQLMGAATLATVILFMGFFVMEWRAENEARRFDERLAGLVAESRELTAALAARDQRASFRQSIADAEALLAASQAVRLFLSQMQLDNEQGFSVLLKDLARSTERGMSLARIDIESGGRGVMLKGFTVESERVPRFVKKLEQSESQLRQHKFNSRITQTENGHYAFELNTTGFSN
ncbi:MAG: PilN domain-containing protein [Gammaproteobacteria bacterium]|jgi:outer membrane translocation and assembly module TamA|nr:PilN domain-containing protein [Gammaproteobacteria bacterium]